MVLVYEGMGVVFMYVLFLYVVIKYIKDVEFSNSMI